jgi:ketosteroid isomerase-like protein
MTDEEGRLTMLRQIAHAFDTHDLDAIMAWFADDAIFETPSGPDAYGRRAVGKPAVRQAVSDRFTGIPDVRYTQDDHFVAGDRGASEWTLSGTTSDGERLEFRGCDLWTFRDGLVVKKDSYWKIRTQQAP